MANFFVADQGMEIFEANIFNLIFDHSFNLLGLNLRITSVLILLHLVRIDIKHVNIQTLSTLKLGSADSQALSKHL